MIKKQVGRVKQNILPFLYVGLFVGLFVGKASWFRQFDWIREYLSFARINTSYPDSGQRLFFDHFNPNILTLLLVVLFTVSAIHRIIFGKHERYSKNDVGQTLEIFGSMLSIAWLGLILGITPAVLVFQGFSSFMAFVVNAVYPLLFLVEIVVLRTFLDISRLVIVPVPFNWYREWRVGVRLDGILVLALAGVMLAFQQWYNNELSAFTGWVRSLV